MPYNTHPSGGFGQYSGIPHQIHSSPGFRVPPMPRLAVSVSGLPATPLIPDTQSRPIVRLAEGGTAVEESPQTPLPLWNRTFLRNNKLA